MRAARRLPSIALLLIVASLFAAASADAQQKNSWDSAIDSFAAKIAAIAGAHASVRLNVRNLSFLDDHRAEDFRLALEANLHRRGLKLAGDDQADATANVTVGNNLRSIIFAVDVRRGDAHEVEIVSLDREDAAPPGQTQEQVRLQRDTIWSQPEPILDFLVVPAMASDAKRLFVLEPRRLVIYRAAADGWQAQESHPLLEMPASRGPYGALAIENSGGADAALEVQIPGQRCVGGLTGAMQLKCDYDARPLPTLQEQRAPLGNLCGENNLTLASGNRDWTQTDAVSVMQNGVSRNLARETLAFSGPVMALRASTAANSARVVWKDLPTGDYEAALVTANCGD